MKFDLQNVAGGVVGKNEVAISEGIAALHGDRRNVALGGIAVTFTVISGAIYLLTRHPGPWVYAMAFLCIGLMQYRIVMACHEAVHKKLLFPLWLNESAGSVLCGLIGINLFWYRYQHLGHHAAQDVGHDTDAYIYAPILRRAPGTRRLAVWVFGTAAEVIEKIRLKTFPVNVVVKRDARARIHAMSMFLIQGLLLACCILWFSWWYYLAFWLLPLLTIATFMNRTRVLIEHGYPHVPRLEGSALRFAPVRTVDFSASFLERFFIAPYRFDYHFAHHSVPSIPYYRIRDLARLLEQNGNVAPSATHPSYFEGLRHVLWH